MYMTLYASLLLVLKQEWPSKMFPIIKLSNVFVITFVPLVKTNHMNQFLILNYRVIKPSTSVTNDGFY